MISDVFCYFLPLTCQNQQRLKFGVLESIKAHPMASKSDAVGGFLYDDGNEKPCDGLLINRYGMSMGRENPLSRKRSQFERAHHGCA